MSAKVRGTRRELQIVDWYAKRDWVAMRSPASLGVADVIALKAGEGSHLVQVKATADGPYKSFGPADRAELLHVARMAGALALLAWWPPRGKLMFFSPEMWPKGSGQHG